MYADDGEEEIAKNARHRASYPATYEEYGRRYDAKARTIRSWVRDGQKCGDLPPLEDPAALVTWWARRRRNRVPPGILSAAAQRPLGPEKFSDNQPTGGGGSEKNQAEQIGGAEEALRQAREMAQLAYRHLVEAKQNNDPGGVEMWRKDWTECVETQRKWEKDFDKIQEMRGLLVRKSAVQVELAAVANVLQRAFLAEMESLLKEFCPALSPESRRSAAVSRRDRCFEVLRRGSFGPNLFTSGQ